MPSSLILEHTKHCRSCRIHNFSTRLYSSRITPPTKNYLNLKKTKKSFSYFVWIWLKHLCYLRSNRLFLSKVWILMPLRRAITIYSRPPRVGDIDEFSEEILFVTGRETRNNRACLESDSRHCSGSWVRLARVRARPQHLLGIGYCLPAPLEALQSPGASYATRVEHAFQKCDRMSQVCYLEKKRKQFVFSESCWYEHYHNP